MKDLTQLKVPSLIGESETKAIDALPPKKRTKVQTMLEYVTHIVTAFPQGADGEPTPSGGCPCGGCYKSDERMRDAITALAAVVEKYGYEVVRWYCTGLEENGELLSALLTIYLNLPDKAQPRKQKNRRAAA